MTPVDTLYEEYMALDGFLKERNEPSLKILAESNFKKNLILSIASYFEFVICNELVEYCFEISKPSPIVGSLVKNKAISRQYHTLFKWDDKNGANQFFGLLGDEFKRYMKELLRLDNLMTKGVEAFLEIGNERNRLVHQNFASYNIEKTIFEIYESYTDALYFTGRIKDLLSMKTAGGTDI